ncbi:hypothetical protein APHAL10511_004860 [Amanita phalloides]|nr:hypothetical protein APHAL10511_004860 [Amanita phalloides]
MDDIDDFIVDDITLDDETLALLDEEEQKYLRTQNNELIDAPPVSKKRKLDSGWRSGHPDPDDFEDLPEISVQRDGTYDVRDVVNTSVSTPRDLLNVSNVDNSSGSTTRPTTAAAPSTTQQQLRDSTRAEYVPEIAPRTSSPYSREVGQNIHLEHQLQLLQRKFHEVSGKNQTMQIALEKVTDLKLTKEGEATILRKDLERAVQDHAARIANLKAAKEEADAKQTQVRKDLEAEIERLKGQLTFKHHESESSLRRAQHSARTSKIYKDPLTTPVRRFSQVPQLASETPRPSGPLIGQEQEFGHHIETPRIRRHKSPRKTNPSGILPGFQNAFLSSPLIRPRTDVIVEGSPPGSPMARSPPSSPTAHFIRSSNNFGIVERSDLTQYRSHMVIESDTDFIIVEDEEKSQALEPIIQPINWGSELSRIVLTHSLPGSMQPTLQVLLMTSSSLVEVDAAEFAAACSDIFEVLANISTILDHNMTRRLSCLLIKMLLIIGSSEQYCSIRSLIHLLTTLVRSVPEFGPYLLSQPNPCIHVSFPDAVREIVTRHLSSAKKTGALADEIIGLLEALCLCTTDDIIAELSPLVEDGQVWAALLRNVHGESLLTRACRLLVLFGSRPTLARALINVSGVQSKDGDMLERLSLIDRLCTFLYETIGSSECNEMREQILSFFATLSLTHLDSHTTLTNSDVLIPSLVYLSSNLANPLWEEDGSVLQNLATLIKMIKQTVTLIHHLVFGTKSSLSLGLRLHHNPRRVLNGLNHMFIVCFGRLSYADPPEWIDKTMRHELESLSDMARELLDLVVDGPESDSIWSLYQEDPDKNESEMDEGEIEARLMGD